MLWVIKTGIFLGKQRTKCKAMIAYVIYWQSLCVSWGLFWFFGFAFVYFGVNYDFRWAKFASPYRSWNITSAPMVLSSDIEEDPYTPCSFESSSSVRPVTKPTSLLANSKPLPSYANNANNDFNLDRQRDWMKVLYLKQGVPDNYVPNSFLQDLRKNGLWSQFAWKHPNLLYLSGFLFFSTQLILKNINYLTLFLSLVPWPNR